MRAVLRLLCISLLAIGAFGASAAQAAIKFAAEKYPATFATTVTEEHVLKTEKAEIKCKNASFSGSLTKAQSTISVTPAYANCTVAGLGTPVDFYANGCEYVLIPQEEKQQHEYAGQAEIVCPEPLPGEEEEMLFEAVIEGKPQCRVWIPAQGGLGQFYFTNNTNGAGEADDEITIKAQLESEIHHHVEKIANCLDTPGTYEFGTYLGGSKLFATNGGKQVGIQVKDE